MHPPSSLVELQEKFGKALLGKISPSGPQGIDIYCYTYFRNIGEVLKRHFPTLPLLLGEDLFFKKIGDPFIQKRPPQDWQLERYGEGLTAWLKKEGLSRLNPLLLPLAEIEETFLKISFPLETKGFLKGEVEVVDTIYPLIQIRKMLLARTPLPKFEPKRRGFVLYCDQEGHLFGVEVDPFEATLLKLLKEQSLDGALEKLVEDHSLPLDSLETLLPTWSSKWARLQWINPANMPSLPL